MNYVVGDIQGCYSGLKELLKKVKFNSAADTLWAVGDLIARGEDSLSTLEYLYDLGDHFKPVLGNHDLHFLSVASGIKKLKPADLLQPVLDSIECAKYVDWMRHFPLVRQVNSNTLLVHAGIYPKWSSADALRYSGEIEAELQSDSYIAFLSAMYSNANVTWKKAKQSQQRLPFIVNALTRMRYVDQSLNLNFSEKCSPEFANPELIPWYQVENAKLSPQEVILFGHWASLLGKTNTINRITLDTGYVWGNSLSCLCLESGKLSSVQA